MKNFLQVVKSVLNGTCSGTFRLRNNEMIPSTDLRVNTCPILGYDYPYILGNNGKTYTSTGLYYYGQTTPFDIMEFIKDNNNNNKK